MKIKTGNAGNNINIGNRTNSAKVIIALAIAVIALGAFAVRGSFLATDGENVIEVNGEQ